MLIDIILNQMIYLKTTTTTTKIATLGRQDQRLRSLKNKDMGHLTEQKFLTVELLAKVTGHMV